MSQTRPAALEATRAAAMGSRAAPVAGAAGAVTLLLNLPRELLTRLVIDNYVFRSPASLGLRGLRLVCKDLREGTAEAISELAYWHEAITRLLQTLDSGHSRRRWTLGKLVGAAHLPLGPVHQAGITDESYLAVGQLVQWEGLPNLRYLCVRGQLSDALHPTIPRMMFSSMSRGTLSTLQHLALVNIPLGPEQTSALRPVLSPAVLPLLKFLTLNTNPIGNEALLYLVPALLKMRWLRELNYFNTGTDSDVIVSSLATRKEIRVNPRPET